jgi:hypothetical protein
MEAIDVWNLSFNIKLSTPGIAHCPNPGACNYYRTKPLFVQPRGEIMIKSCCPELVDLRIFCESYLKG